MHGIVRAIEAYTGATFRKDVNIYPVENELRAGSLCVDEILYNKNEPEVFWERFQQFSPHFTSEIKTQIKSTSVRKIAQHLGLPTGMDAQCIVDILSNSEKE